MTQGVPLELACRYGAPELSGSEHNLQGPVCTRVGWPGLRKIPELY